MHRVQIRQKMKLEFNRLALLVRNDPILQLTRLGMTEGKKSHFPDWNSANEKIK